MAGIDHLKQNAVIFIVRSGVAGDQSEPGIDAGIEIADFTVFNLYIVITAVIDSDSLLRAGNVIGITVKGHGTAERDAGPELELMPWLRVTVL